MGGVLGVCLHVSTPSVHRPSVRRLHLRKGREGLTWRPPLARLCGLNATGCAAGRGHGGWAGGGGFDTSLATAPRRTPHAPAGRHTLRITKLSEARFGGALLKGIGLSASGRFVAPPATPGQLSDRRMLFLGDSVT